MDAIYVGLRFLLQLFFQRFINTLGLDPLQVNPNVYQYMSALYISHKLGIGELSLAKFKYIYLMKNHLVGKCLTRIVVFST